MKRINSNLLASMLCASLALGAGSAAAQDKTAAASDPLARFVGSGTCSGNVFAMGKQPGHATTGKYSARKILDDHWVELHYDEDESAAAPKPFHVVQYFGYDAAKKHYVSVLVDNSEDGYSTGTSAGWNGDSITFDESTDGKTVSFRDAFTAGPAGPSSHTGWMKDKSSKWVKTDEETCKRS